MDILALIFLIFIFLVIFLRVCEFLRERKPETKIESEIETEKTSTTSTAKKLLSSTRLKELVDCIVFIAALIIFAICVCGLHDLGIF